MVAEGAFIRHHLQKAQENRSETRRRGRGGKTPVNGVELTPLPR